MITGEQPAADTASESPRPPSLNGLNVVVPTQWLGDVAPATTAALDLAIGALTAAGASVRRGDEAFGTLDEQLNTATS